MLNFLKNLFSSSVAEAKDTSPETSDELSLSEYELGKVKEKNFNFIAYMDTDAKESAALKHLVRQTLNQPSERTYVYDVTYQEKRQFDSISYDYKYTHYKVYLTEEDKWEEVYQDTTYSQDFED